MDKNDLLGEYLKSFDEIEIILNILSFKKHSVVEKGFACYIEYRKENKTKVEFLFGPSDWDIEMIIITLRGKFTFKDLLSIPEISSWVHKNRYRQDNRRFMKNELEWFINLLEVSLPYVE